MNPFVPCAYADYAPLVHQSISWFLAIVSLIAACGCGRRVELSPVPEAQLREQSETIGGGPAFDAFVEACAKVPEGTNVMARYQESLNSRAVAELIKQTPGELRRKLETLNRKTNRHPWTKEQLETALSMKSKN